jgi:hypothetical protein
MIRTDRKLADSEKEMLLRLGHQSVSVTVAPHEVSKAVAAGSAR